MLFTVFALQTGWSNTPNWWNSRGVILTNAFVDDYAAANIGQLKTIAKKAIDEMNDKWGLSGGAGVELNQLAENWQLEGLSERDDYSVVTIGQLKTVAKYFYNKLNQLDNTIVTPNWLMTGHNDHAIANIGQVKTAFSFNINAKNNTIIAPGTWNGNKHSDREMVEPVISPPSFTINQGIQKPYPTTILKNPVATTNYSFEMRQVSAGKLYYENDLPIYDENDVLMEYYYKNGSREEPYFRANRPNVSALFAGSWAHLGNNPGILGGFKAVYSDDSSNPNWDNWDEKAYEFRISTTNGSADRDIIHNFDVIRQRDDHPPAVVGSVTFYIPKGGSQSATYTLSINENPSNTKIKKELGAGRGPSGYVIKPGDSAGPRYRKLGLNGVPMPDSKPQVSDESDIENEETYVDSYNRQIRHSVTDIWSQSSSSLLPIKAQRDITAESWSWRSDLRPNERPDKPFGVCWTSNLTPHIRLDHAEGILSTENPSYATVIDEQGASRTFMKLAHNGPWIPSLNEKQNAKTVFDTLTQNGQYFFLRKKYGSTCIYSIVDSLDYLITKDREYGSTSYRQISFARMESVRSRYDDVIYYEYPNGPGTLIPRRIYDAQRPSLEMRIEQNQNGRITRIQGSDGNITEYIYENYNFGSIYNENVICQKLIKVKKGAFEVNYDYDYKLESDENIGPQHKDSTSPGTQDYGHFELSFIKDEKNNPYHFIYSLDQSCIVETDFGHAIRPIINLGRNRILTQIKRPDETSINFSGLRDIRFNIDGTIENNGFNTFVSGPCGSYNYLYSDPHIFRPDSENIFSRGVTQLTFTRQKIISQAGTEVFTFNPEAAMALSSVTDASNKTTTFNYTDSIPVNSPIKNQLNILKILYYDDPTVEIDPDLNPKYFTYHPGTRVMMRAVDQRGTITNYGIQSVTGLRTSEEITNSSGDVLKVSRFNYDDPDFPGFMTEQIIETTGLNGYDAEIPMGEMRTKFVPDDNGRIAHQIVYAGTLEDAADPDDVTKPLVTSYTYTGNGSKKSVTDPRGNTTIFDYYPDTLRLSSITFPDDTGKSFEYDAHGNMEKEIDERGIATFHEYDEFNRRIKTTLDLNGNDLPDGMNEDIVTSIIYNAFNLPEFETNPNGVRTRHEYDEIGRRTKTTVNFDGPEDTRLITTYVDEDPATPDWVGGSVFDISNFKPLRVKDPRGFVTSYEYDNFHRVRTSTLLDTSYTPAQIVRTSTIYDAVGNPTHVTDALGRVTITDYDGLNRPWKVSFPKSAQSETNPDLTVPSSDRITRYTPGGQVWSITDELNHTIRHYLDNAGRVVRTVYPIVMAPADTGAWEMASPETWTAYDENGNMIQTRDARGHITETEYDTRNRAVRVVHPPVTDAKSGDTVRPMSQTFYYPNGLVEKVVDPLGAETVTFYDNANRVQNVHAPTTEVVNDDGQSEPQYHVTIYSHDKAGNILTVTDPRSKTLTNFYDDLNRLEKTKDAEEIENIFAYDKAGNRTRVRDGKSNVTSFEYDAQNRLTRQTFYDGDEDALDSQTLHYYHNALHKISQTDASNATTQFFYDVRDRLRVIQAPDFRRVMTYDKTGRLLSSQESPSNPETSVANVWDALGRLEQEVSQGVTHAHGYDLAGNRVRSELGTGRVITTVYDALNRPETLAEGGRHTVYGYDTAGRALHLTQGNGQTVRNTYDEMGRLTRRTLHASHLQINEAGQLADFSWRHDANGNVTRQQERWNHPDRPSRPRVTSMEYDDANRLVRETVHDPVPSTETDTTQTVTDYEYDDSNNRVGKSVVFTGGAPPASLETGYWEYIYNGYNQLLSWARYNAQANDPGRVALKTASLEHDPNGNREKQTIFNSAGSGASASLTSQGITYTAHASGAQGNQARVNLLSSVPGSPLAVSITGSEISVLMETELGVPDVLVNQGITYSARQVHSPERQTRLSLEAFAPGQSLALRPAQDEGWAKGDVRVILETDNGDASWDDHQGLRFEAATPGPEGNVLKVSLRKSTTLLPEPVVEMQGDSLVLTLADGGTPDVLNTQGMVFATKTSHDPEREVRLSLEADEPDQAAEVSQDANDIRVFLETGPGAAASSVNQGITYTSAIPGAAGNEVRVRLEAAFEDELTLGNPMVSKVEPHEIVMRLATMGGQPATLTLPGISYSAVSPGTAYNGISVSHRDPGPGKDEIEIQVNDRHVDVWLPTSKGDPAQAILFGSTSGPLTLTAIDEGSEGNSIIVIADAVYNQDLQVLVDDKLIYVILGTDDQGIITYSTSEVAEAIRDAASHLVTVSGGDSYTMPFNDYAFLSGGGDNHVIYGYVWDIQYALSQHPVASSMIYVNNVGDGTLTAGMSGHLTGGIEPEYQSTVDDVVGALAPVLVSMASPPLIVTGSGSSIVQPASFTLSGGANFEVLSTADDVVALLAGHSLITAQGGGGTPLQPIPQTALAGGRESALVTTAAEVVTLLAGHTQVRATLTGSPTAVVQPAELELSGGGENFQVLSTAAQVAALLVEHPLITAEVEPGAENDVLEPLERTALSGGEEPAVITTAAQLVAALQPEVNPAAAALVTAVLASGTGDHVLEPLGPLHLSGGGGYEVTHYTWDSQNRLTGVSTPGGGAHAYSYDHRTRRVGVTSHTAEGAGAGAKRRAISFVGGLSAAEWEAENAPPDLSGAPAVEYTRGPDMGGGVGGLLYSLRREGGASVPVAKYNLSNGRGDIVAQSDQSAALTWTASYEAGGKRTKETGSNADKQRANSKGEDPTGLLNEGFRYRDLETMTWLSRDPAGFVDGPNLYAYVRQNPWTAFDAKGLWQLKVHGDMTNEASQNLGLSDSLKRHLWVGVMAPDIPDGPFKSAINYKFRREGTMTMRTHHGDLQPWHFMGRTGQDTAQSVKENAIGFIMKNVEIFRGSGGDLSRAQRDAHLGCALHTIQDSFSASHTTRDIETGEITRVQDYSYQSADRHKTADTDITSSARTNAVRMTEGFLSAVLNGVERPDGTRSQDPKHLREYLDKTVFPMSEDAVLHGSEPAFENRPTDPKGFSGWDRKEAISQGEAFFGKEQD